MHRNAIQWIVTVAIAACIAIPATAQAQRLIRGIPSAPAVHTLGELKQEGFECSREAGAWKCKSGLAVYICATSTAPCERQPLGPLVRQRINS